MSWSVDLVVIGSNHLLSALHFHLPFGFCAHVSVDPRMVESVLDADSLLWISVAETNKETLEFIIEEVRVFARSHSLPISVMLMVGEILESSVVLKCLVPGVVTAL